jgi:hypothetical protein
VTSAAGKSPSTRFNPERRLSRQGLVRVLVLTGAVFVAGAVVTVLALGHFHGRGGRGAADASRHATNATSATNATNVAANGTDVAATAAQSAALVATSNGVALGSLRVAELNHQAPVYRWVAGSETLPFSAAPHRLVGTVLAGDHVVTAVQTGRGFTSARCEFGLSVSSSADPIVDEDHLPGTGTYVGPAAATTLCRANGAPRAGWVRYR